MSWLGLFPLSSQLVHIPMGTTSVTESTSIFFVILTVLSLIGDVTIRAYLEDCDTPLLVPLLSLCHPLSKGSMLHKESKVSFEGTSQIMPLYCRKHCMKNSLVLYLGLQHCMDPAYL